MTQALLKDLARAKAVFQLRAIVTVTGMEENLEQCGTCGDYHEPGEVPFTCETGDGQ